MEAVLTLPMSLEQRLELPDELRVPASWEEFLDLLPNCPYRIEYDDHEIISIMGYASENHEKIALQIAHLLRQILGDSQYEFYGSNLALHIPDQPKRYFNADCTVVKGETQKVNLKGNMYAVANPFLLVEVLSASTYDHDLGRKFREYRKIDSLQQVIFIDSVQYSVISQQRLPGTHEWTLQEFNTLEQTFPVLDNGKISLQDLYHKISFDAQ